MSSDYSERFPEVNLLDKVSNGQDFLCSFIQDPVMDVPSVKRVWDEMISVFLVEEEESVVSAFSCLHKVGFFFVGCRCFCRRGFFRNFSGGDDDRSDW